MKTITFSELFTADITVTDLYAERQKWVDGILYNSNFPRPYSAIIYLNACTGKYTSLSSGESFYADKKSLICLPYGSEYTVLNITSSSCETDAFLIEFNIKQGSEILTLGSSPFMIKCPAVSPIPDLMEKAANAKASFPNSPILLQSIIFSVIAEIGKESQKQILKKYKSIEKGIEFLEQNPFCKKKIDDIAAECFVSGNCFRRLFKEYSGKTPSQFRNDLKIEMSKRLLETTDITVDVISQMIGFENSANFYKLFKSVVKKSPNEYRKSFLI